MRHPHEEDLALYASGDLGYFHRRGVESHLGACPRCRQEVEEFRRLRRDLSSLEEIPEVPWARLAAEMKANIHVGLEAGACVPDDVSVWLPAGRTWFAYAGLLALLWLAFWIERPGPGNPPGSDNDGVVLAATGNGIELKQAGSSLSLMHGRARDVTLTVSTQGAMRARYVDSDTGQVTINNVYVQ
jgi:anti-sigma factor RsiW